MHSVRIFVAALLMFAVNAAEATPSQVLNKTITVSFTARGTSTPVGGQPRTFNTAITQTIYVSSAGRVFRKYTANAVGGRGSENGGFAPSQGNGSFAFQGDRLVGIVPFALGARQITISFSSDFTNCTATIIEGRASNGVIRRKAPNGEMVELSNGATTSPSCAVQAGNAFAQ